MTESPKEILADGIQQIYLPEGPKKTIAAFYNIIKALPRKPNTDSILLDLETLNEDHTNCLFFAISDIIGSTRIRLEDKLGYANGHHIERDMIDLMFALTNLAVAKVAAECLIDYIRCPAPSIMLQGHPVMRDEDLITVLAYIRKYCVP